MFTKLCDICMLAALTEVCINVQLLALKETVRIGHIYDICMCYNVWNTKS